MKKLLISVSIVLASMAATGTSQAGSFDWIEGLTIQARSDLSAYRVRLQTRFKIGDVTVRSILEKTKGEPGDAYMVLRMSEMSGRPVDTVLHEYKRHRKQGWGRMARNLGIKPGSRAFHALKNGHDLEGYGRHGGKGKGRGKGRGHGGGPPGHSKGKGKGKKW